MSNDIWKHVRGTRATAPAETHAPAKPKELRLHGLNAVLALFAHTPQRLRKVYLTEARVSGVKDLLKWCAQNRVGYRVVEEGDLAKLAQTSHHEGIVADVLPAPEKDLDTWLREMTAADTRVCALWLDGVGNPHNLGAILRNAAHFGATAVLIESTAPSPVSGASARVAEGGAEQVTMVRLPADAKQALRQLREAGFVLAATLVHEGDNLFTTDLPGKLVYVMGAEQQGMHKGLAEACDLKVSIPGTGGVESLNVASATAVFLAEWARRNA